MLLTPEAKLAQLQLTPTNPDQKIQKLTGKYSRLRRELSLAMRSAHSQTVCSVTVVDSSEAHEGSESEQQSDDIDVVRSKENI